MSVLLAGGGTAGHVNPLLAVADEIVRRHPAAQVTVLGTAEGLEARLVPAHGYPLAIVPRVPLPRRPSLDLLRLPGRLRAAVAAAGRAIDESGAQVVVGFGGYVATPAYLAARRRGVPIVVHEQNARPGLANRLGARWAQAVAVTFPGTELRGARVTGLPLRRPVADLVAARAVDAAAARRAAAAELGLDPDLPTLVVTGGSLGAASVNAAVAGAAGELLGAGVQVLHLTGRDKSAPVHAVLGELGLPEQVIERYHVREYLDDMHLALACADLVVGRAGAGTVCEVAALGLPAVYVPLPVGNGEQRRNAAGVVAAGGALLVDDAALDPAWVVRHVVPLLVGSRAADERARMGAAAAGAGFPDASGRVADLVDALRPAGGPTRADAAAPAAAARSVGASVGASVGTSVATAGDQLVVADLGRVHLVGVGGAGMSAIALLLAARGLRVSGSDAADGPALPALRAAGVAVTVGHDAALVTGVDTLVVSSAVRESNPELSAARAAGTRVLHRSEALAALMADRDAVAVAGAHGKTTTSAMVATALAAAGADPSFAIGGTVLTADGALGGARDGSGAAFVAEADESDGSFLAYRPLVALVTNVEPDHLDHYGSREAFEGAFVAFAERVRDGGTLVACADDEGARALVARVRTDLADRGVAVVTYGRAEDADVRVGELARTAAGWTFEVGSGDAAATITLSMPGEHVALNAAGAWAACAALGVAGTAAAAGLAQFRGTGRRFEDRGTAGGVRVVDDYAHHPTEVTALLRAARSVAGEGRVLVLFQPHLYSRTRTFAAEFGAALDLADVVVVTDVYAAREDPDPTVSGATVVEQVPTSGRATYVADRHEAALAVAAAARPGDLLLTVGAGDVTLLADVVLAALGGRP
ncbi:UDP-N-acetylmuramate--L-alanine ligase [Cellulomonas sp. DKR-3]|uniref:Multifunctional fusion protein n=1 Tax=Cellulomonas fulva TaxID=2835530 RepID=A0ABS5U355_9CELL|nr:UDP-N-acetylmuramate--L-alanine ligase [Cellulomonas fulva]